MLRQLKRKIIALNMSLISLFLLAIGVVAVRYGETTAEARYKDSFTALCKALEYQLAATDIINHREIYELESKNSLLVWIYDGDSLLENAYIPGTADREMLRELALLAVSQHAADTAASQASVRPEYDLLLEAGGEEYFLKYLNLRSRNSNTHLYALHSTKEYRGEINSIRWTYACLLSIAFLLLLFLNIFLAGRAIKPTQKALRAQKEFIAAASHELKSPLAVISANTDMLDKDKPRHKEYMDCIQAETRRMGHLIDDLLLLAQTGVGTLPLQTVDTDLEGLLMEVCEGFQPLAAASGHSLALALPAEPLPSIQADPERLKQVLAALLQNALIHTPQGTSITASAEAVRKGICLRVTDNGPGLADKEQVFERFYKEDASRTDKNSFGLGLSIAREIAQLHGGSLTAEDALGGGAAFVLLLPEGQAGLPRAKQ